MNLRESPGYQDILDEGAALVTPIITAAVTKSVTDSVTTAVTATVTTAVTAAVTTATKVEAVLDAMDARFGTLPDSVLEKVRETSDVARLNYLLRQAIQSASLHDFLVTLG